MKTIIFALILMQACFTASCFAISVSTKEANIIADKIWKNECAGTIEGLTTWNEGENFASLGIGHFIWYVSKPNEPFQETFPELLRFLHAQGVKIPKWLRSYPPCPWKTRDEFYKHIQSPKMCALRKFLLKPGVSKRSLSLNAWKKPCLK